MKITGRDAPPTHGTPKPRPSPTAASARSHDLHTPGFHDVRDQPLKPAHEKPHHPKVKGGHPR
jgi:hypothetical protein